MFLYKIWLLSTAALEQLDQYTNKQITSKYNSSWYFVFIKIIILGKADVYLYPFNESLNEYIVHCVLET